MRSFRTTVPTGTEATEENKCTILDFLEKEIMCNVSQTGDVIGGYRFQGVANTAQTRYLLFLPSHYRYISAAPLSARKTRRDNAFPFHYVPLHYCFKITLNLYFIRSLLNHDVARLSSSFYLAPRLSVS